MEQAKTGLPKWKTLLKLLWSTLYISAFTFGGGYAMLPMLQKEVVNGRHWATDEELMITTRLVSVHRVSSRSTRRRLSVIRIGGFRGRLRRHWESLRRRLSSL